MIHLHLHTSWSLRDSTIKIENLVEKLVSENIYSCAITDHGVISGWVEFYYSCVDNNIKPILGCEFYFADKNNRKERYHVILLAKNQEGIKNIIKLNNIAYKDNFYYYPLIFMEDLLKYNEGIIILTACIKSLVVYSEDIIKQLKDYFELYLEIMLHDFSSQKKHNFRMLELSDKYNVPLILTQDVHYLTKEDYETHCIIKKMDNTNEYEGNTYFFANMQNISELAKEHQYIPKEVLLSAIKNTHKIVRNVNAVLETKSNYLGG